MKRHDGHNPAVEQLAIARLIDLRLKSNPAFLTNADTSSAHPDTDTITSFVEGRLESADAESMTSHLVKCSSCRFLTAQLARTELPADESGDAVSAEEGSLSVDRLIERLRNSLVPSTEDAVFAYHETDRPTGEQTETENSAQDEE